jgi:two-component system sensor histidine kinase DegS
MSIDFTLLDQVIDKTLQTMEDSRYQIFEIAEQAREETRTLQNEIDEVKREVSKVIQLYDQLEIKLKRARIRLSEVSRDFQTYTEEDIRKAYEQASAFQLQCSLLKEKENQLRERRDDLQFRLKKLEATVEKAENVLTQISVVLEYLTGNLKEMAQYMKDAEKQKQLGLKVIQAQEEERKRLAREIHDGPAQSIAHLVLRMDMVDKLLQQDKVEQAKAELTNLKEIAREGLGDVRRIIFDLRPMALDDLGLVPTLQKYVEKLSQTHGITIDFQPFGNVFRPPLALEVALFRLVQEALNNVIKHSRATYAQVKADLQEDQVYVVIKDNGVGFDTKEKKGAGFGILGMHERIKLLNGNISVVSTPGQGTKVMVSIPLESKEGEKVDEPN